MKKIGLALCALLFTLSFNPKPADAETLADKACEAPQGDACKKVCSNWRFGRASDAQVIAACGGKTTTKTTKSTGRTRTRTGTGNRNRKAKDPDKDGIVGKADKCPDKPETVNGYKDDDGCPDEKPVLTIQERIEQLEKRRQEDGEAIESLKPSFTRRNADRLIWLPTTLSLVAIIFCILLWHRQALILKENEGMAKLIANVKWDHDLLAHTQLGTPHPGPKPPGYMA